MINPMRIPGVDETLDPLDPVNDAAHDGFFVDIDRSFEAFRAFQDAFASERRLAEQGAVVVAVGDRGYGKTALLNRCANWLRETITASPSRLRAEIIDLRFLAMEGVSTTERLREVCHHLLRSLSYARLVAGDDLPERPQPEDVLPYLSSQLDDDQAIIVLAPPTDDSFQELVLYARFASKRVIVLCETAFARRFEEHRPRFTDRVKPLVLRLGTLNKGDGDKFYVARRSLHAADAVIVPPDQGALEKVIAMRDMSVGEFQSLLLGAYDDVRRQHPPTGRLTYDQIVTYFVRNSTFGGQQ